MSKLFLQIAFLVSCVVVFHEARYWDEPAKISIEDYFASIAKKAAHSAVKSLFTDVNKLKLRVYYETLCPASVDFIVNELAPAVQLLGEHIDVDLIPYGHATTWSVRGRLQFNCQHGPDECLGNKLHSCAIHGLINRTRAVQFTACLLKYSVYDHQKNSMDFGTALNWCGYTQSIPRRDIWICTTTEKGSQLLRNHGDTTQLLNPPYVPYVTLGNSSTNEILTAGELSRKICRTLMTAPPICDTYK